MFRAYPAVYSANPTPDPVSSPVLASLFVCPRDYPAGRHRSPAARRGGFALLITIVLVAFLVLLLVGLATFTRVETQVATNSAQLAQARANALFALNLAVGQLQRYAGPDQAVTARADIDAANTGNPAWIGVWDAVARDASGNPLATPTHAAAPPSNAPMAWLVSGNETNGTALTPVTPAVTDPETDVNNVWLVHKVFGQELAPQLPTFPLDGRVKLKKSLIQVPAGQLPGFDATSTTPTPIGAYAWWVGDEGIKAKVNLTDPYRAAAVNAPETAWRRTAPPRPGLEMLTVNELKTVFTDTTDAFEAKRERLLVYQQLPMLHDDLATATGLEQSGRYFNDLTATGYGVLADTLRGGLRRDLTRGLAASPAAGSTAATETGDSAAVFTLPAPGPVGSTSPSQTYTSNGEPAAPVWAQVRSFWAKRANSSGTIAPVEAPLTNPGVVAPSTEALLPIPTMVRLGYGMDVSSGNYRFIFTPVVVLCNPYNVTLAPSTYRLKYQSFSSFGYQAKYTLSVGAVAGSSSPTTLGFPASTLVKTILFDIALDGFAPGEVRIYTAASIAPFDPAAGSPIALSPGYRATYVYQDTSTPVASPTPPSASVELTSIAGSQQPTISLGIGTTPSELTRYIEMEPKRDKLEKSNRPSKAVINLSATAPLYAVRFRLRDATTDINSDGNQPGSANHRVPSSHPAYASDGSTVRDFVSGARMLIDNNPRAVVSQRLGGWDNVATWGFDALNPRSPYSDDMGVDYDGDNGYWGGGITGDQYSSTHVILFDVLRQNEQVVSLGRLGQVNWGVDGKHPAYPLGNSFASIFYKYNTPDCGYALNEALWDRFFLSTLPTSLASRPANLPNSRLRFHDPAGASTSLTALEDVNGYQLAATRLMIDGAFNINSTSVEAWTAFLGSVQAADYAYDARTGARTDSSVRPFPRFQNLHDPDPTSSGNSGNLYEWTGYRQLNATQLRALAAQIVAGIKARGRPARSLAEFINRDLSQPADDSRNQMGIVQAAINSVINADEAPASGGNGVGWSDLSGLNTALVVKDTLVNADNPDAAKGKLRATGAPGFLMQGDLLTPLAPAMSARSDTFRVRAYGEGRNPVTGEITGRAWCEAIVQRLPEFVGGESSELRLNDPALGAASKTFGRKFVILQFRWLDFEEI